MNDGMNGPLMMALLSVIAKPRNEGKHHIYDIHPQFVVWHLDTKGTTDESGAGNFSHDFANVVTKRCSSHSKQEQPGSGKQRV